MSDITLTSAVRQNLLSLQQTAQLLETTQNHLATGKKVNSALDNPTNFFTASSLDARASDISALLDGIGNGVQVLQAANDGITALQGEIDTAKSFANQALQAGVAYSPKSLVTTTPLAGATAANLLGTPTGAPTNANVTGNAVNSDSAGTAISGTTALNGADDTNPAATDGLSPPILPNSTLVVNGRTLTFINTGTAGPNDIDLRTSSVQDLLDKIDSVTGASGLPTPLHSTISTSGAITVPTGETSDLTISSNPISVLSALGLASLQGVTQPRTPGPTPLGGLVLQIAATGGGQPSTITFGTGIGQVSNLNQLNQALAPNNLLASIDSSGAITITTTSDAASSTIGALSGTATNAGNLFANLVAAPPIADPNAQSQRANLVKAYNAIIDSLTNTAQDSSFNGINLLAGDTLKLVFNENGRSQLNIVGVNFTPAGLGLGQLVPGVDFVDNNATSRVLTALNNAQTTLRTEAQALGSNLSIVQIRQKFSKNLINVLQTGSANLTLADSNEEAANSQALSTRQSISVSALALANQSQQSVLQLLR
jgi:flagellin-like hook-associated protein FlgL